MATVINRGLFVFRERPGLQLPDVEPEVPKPWGSFLLCTSRAKRSETGRQCAFTTFESFKNRFSGYFTSAKSRRTTASLPSKLEADYFRSRYSNDGCGVQAPVHVAFASSLSENGFDFFSARIRENRLRGGPPSRKRSFTRCMPSSRSVCQQSIFSSKTRRKFLSCYQFKRFKCLSSVRLLQDGGHPSSARYPAAQRLARQDRSEGRVFCDPNLARSQKIPALCLEANSPRICMSFVRSCSSPPCIYEDHETSSVASTPDPDSTDNLFGRHSAYEYVSSKTCIQLNTY